MKNQNLPERRKMNKKVYKHAMKKGIYSLSAGIVMVVLVCLLFGSLFVSAHEDTADTDTIYKYYKSIEIQPGDTLWDIAESTMTSEYDSVQEYVQVLKDMNNLESDDIQAGQYLMIAYNDTEFLQ